MPTIVGILTFMSRINFSLSWVEHEKSSVLLLCCHQFETMNETNHYVFLFFSTMAMTLRCFSWRLVASHYCSHWTISFLRRMLWKETSSLMSRKKFQCWISHLFIHKWVNFIIYCFILIHLSMHYFLNWIKNIASCLILSSKLTLRNLAHAIHRDFFQKRKLKISLENMIFFLNSLFSLKT